MKLTIMYCDTSRYGIGRGILSRRNHFVAPYSPSKEDGILSFGMYSLKGYLWTPGCRMTSLSGINFYITPINTYIHIDEHDTIIGNWPWLWHMWEKGGVGSCDGLCDSENKNGNGWVQLGRGYATLGCNMAAWGL